MVSSKNNATYQEKDTIFGGNEQIREVNDTSIRCLPNEITILSETTEIKLVTSTRVTEGAKIMVVESNHNVVEGILGEVTRVERTFTADISSLGLSQAPSRVFFDDAIGVELSVKHAGETTVWNGLEVKLKEFTGYEFIYTYEGLASTGQIFGRRVKSQKTDVTISEPLTSHITIEPYIEKTEIYYLDGRFALIDTFNGGGQKLSMIADAVEANDAVSLRQLNSIESKINEVIEENRVQDSLIAVNTNKRGITLEESANIVTNNSKIGITSNQATAIVANTNKVGITDVQANAILANSNKVGITIDQANAIIENTAKVSMTPAQAYAILENTKKVGITESQALEITANTIKLGMTQSQADAILANTSKVGITASQATAIDENTEAVVNSFRKEDYVTKSRGSLDAGSPVVLSDNGMLDSSIVHISSFNYQGEFNPAPEKEYPDIASIEYGAIWSIKGTGVDGYTYLAGDLLGQVVYNGDLLIYGEQAFGIIKSAFDSNAYYRVDGTISLTETFSGGGQRLANIAVGTESADAVTKGQLDFVKAIADDAVNSNVTQDAAIALNTNKTGISSEQAAAISNNTAKVGITSEQTTDILTNSSKVGITPEQALAININSGKTGITSEQTAAIAVNTSKTGITPQQSADIVSNTKKTGITPDQAANIIANTAKEGITTSQKDAISANTAKTGISSSQASAISINSSKVGITPGQASDIANNNNKTGITSSQSSAITANSAKVGISSSQASAISTNSGKTGVTSEVKSTTSESGAVRVKNMVSMTRSAYDSSSKIADTLYIIKG